MKRMSAADYLAFKAAHPLAKKPKRQQETIEVKSYVEFLNKNNMGFFYRVKTVGTYDPVRKTFRKNNELVGVPDICGFTNSALAVFIEAKRVINVESKKKLIFSVKITDDQKAFLLRAHRKGCLAGIAFNLKDVISIVHADEIRYPRHPRTFFFLPKEELQDYAAKYEGLLKTHAQASQDPITRHVTWAAK